MIARSLLLFLCVCPLMAWAYPPAPFHRVFGSVRDDRGNPLATGVGTIILSGSGNQEIVRGLSDTTGLGPGINYSLPVPIDSGTSGALYTVSALRPLLPFTIRVVIENVSYVPIEMSGTTWTIGTSSDSTRIDLTLGIDSDGDGLPDAWEFDVINGDSTGRLRTLADVRPDDDLDGDGLTNLQEYLIGTYPLDSSDGLALEIMEVNDGFVRLEFLAIRGRTYSITSSSDITNRLAQTFLVGATNGSPGLYYQSDDVRIVEAFVPIPSGDVSGSRKFYWLKVE